MNRTKKLFTNSIIFVIGNMGSKLISFFMVPLYTYYLSTKQFGTVDLLLTTINLCLPLVSLSLYDAVFRFIMDKKINHSQIITTAFLATVVLASISGIIISFFNFLQKPYLILFGCILLFTAIFTMFQNFVRAIGHSAIFAFSGILNTIIFATVNILLLIVLKWGILGYLLSYLIGIFSSTVFLVVKEKLWTYIRIYNFSYKQLKIMLRYSIPLIPNSLAWWLTNDASRFFILMFVGVAGNGIFAVANKLPSIINVFFNVFTQAWQISAVDEFSSKDKSKYFSSVFKYLFGIQVILVATFLFILRPFVSVLFSTQYIDAWKFVPIMLLSVLFSNLSAFLGSIYLAAKKTTGIFTTTIIGMVVNLSLSFTLTPKFGIYGTCIGGALGFLIVVLVRIRDVKKFVKIVVPWKNFIFSITLIVLMNLVLFVGDIKIRYLLISIFYVLITRSNIFVFKSIKGVIHSLFHRKV